MKIKKKKKLKLIFRVKMITKSIIKMKSRFSNHSKINLHKIINSLLMTNNKKFSLKFLKARLLIIGII